MIGIGAGQGEQAFHRIQPAHRIVFAVQMAAFGEAADMVRGVLFAADEIAVQRENDPRFVQLVERLGRRAVCQRRRLARKIQINRLIDMPARVGAFFRDGLLQARARRRTALFEQKGQAAAVAQAFGKRGQTVQGGLAAFTEPLRAQRMARSGS